MSNDVVLYSDEQAMAALLDGADLPEVESGEDAGRQIMVRILGADNVDDILGGNEAVAAQDTLDTDLVLLDFRLMKSAYEEGPNVFAILDVADVETGERMAVTCGSRNVMAQAFQLKRLGVLPQPVRIVKAAKATKAGYYPLWLTKAQQAPALDAA